MKLALLAAVAMLATPALAQENQPTGSAAPGSTNAGPPTVGDARPNAQTPSGQAMSSGDPVGGYQPSAPPMSGPMQPGATVTFQAAQSPDQAYPAPAPMAKYPMCKPGQFDKCMQGAGSTHSRQVHRKKM